MEPIEAAAQALDAVRGGDVHVQAVAAQRAKLANSDTTPSARVLSALQATDLSFEKFGLQQSSAHAEYFRSRPLSAAEHACFDALAKQSLAQQQAMESTQSGDFDAFVAAYNERTPRQLCE
jgi:glutamate--cysteine ligase